MNFWRTTLLGVERTSKNVLTVRHSIIESNWRSRYLLISDVHFDSPYCDRQLLRRHLEEAKEKDAGVIAIGDLFDLMGGRNDPRRSKTDLLNFYNRDDYLDVIVNDFVSFFNPYRTQLVMLSRGNHETSAQRNVESDLLGRACQALNVQYMGYSGWVRFMFERTFASGAKGMRCQKRLLYHHSYGTGGGSTQGSGATLYRSSLYPDADIIATGHIHKAWYHEVPRHRLSANGVDSTDVQYHVQLPTYKREVMLEGGYITEKGGGPAPVGGWWLEFEPDVERSGNVDITITRAK